MCQICVHEIKPNDYITTLECPNARHTFHSDCIENWAKIKLSCPVCHNPIKITLAALVDEENKKALTREPSL